MGITVGLALLLLALLTLLWAARLRASTGLPWAPVVYQDTGGHAPEQTLVSRRHGLSGRPDYLISSRGRMIPVEVKPGRRAAEPYDSDLMQLAAYCLLVEETTGVAPPYGLLRYAERTFRLDYTPRVRDELLDMLDTMREALDAPDCGRSHDQPQRCRACGFYEQCDEALVREED
jgi:CRISPR-associated exonuclease Cas4